MNIVVNACSARLGGGQTYLKQLLARLPAGADLQLFVFAPAGLELPEDRRIHRVEAGWPTANPLLRALWERFSLPRFLHRVNADVLFCPGGVVATPVPRTCRTVTMFRNMIPFDPKVLGQMPWGLQYFRNLILRRVMLKSMVDADLTIFISDHARGVIEALAPIAHAMTIPHGISPAFSTARRDMLRPGGAPVGDYLLYVSRFDIYKHHQEVIRAYASLPAPLRQAHPLVLIGETDLPEARKAVELVSKLGLGDSVLITGPIPYADLPRWYHHAKANIFASSCENCPNILLEALGSGRPILSSDVMPMPEFGGDGLIYFSPYDPASLAASLALLLTDLELEARVAAAAQERSKRYDWDQTARETWACICNTPAVER